MSRGKHINKRPPRVYPRVNRYDVYNAIASNPGITELGLARHFKVCHALIVERLCFMETPDLFVCEDDNECLFIYEDPVS